PDLETKCAVAPPEPGAGPDRVGFCLARRRFIRRSQMPANKVRVGVIGVGRMGERHCRVYSGLANVDFVGITDVSDERRRAVAVKYGVRWFKDVEDLLSEVDAVSIATPAASHFAVAAECLRKRVHALVEKPFTGSLFEARELVRMARRSPVVLQVGYIERFNP